MSANEKSEYLGRTSAVFSRFGEITLKFKWLLLILVVGLTIAAAFGMQNLRFDNSNEVWFVEDDPTLATLDKFREVFGNEDFVVLLFESENFFEPENIKKLRDLAQTLEVEVPHLKDITWLGNVEYIESTEDGISIYELLETIPENSLKMAAVQKKALNEDSYINNLIAPDGKAYTIVLEMDKYPENSDIIDPELEIAPKIREILARPQFINFKPYIVGGPIFHHDFDKLAGRETPLFMGLCIVIQMILLLWLGKGVRGVVVPITIVFLSIIWTMGAIGWIGFTLNTMVIILPSLLICVGIGDSIHFISEYRDHVDHGMPRKEAMVKTFSMIALPCLLTTITTMGAFLSFLTVSIRPFREFGTYAAIGVVAALILTYILVPFFYSFGMNKNNKKRTIKVLDENNKKDDLFDRLLKNIHKIVTKRPGSVVGLFIILSLVSIAGVMKIQLESSVVELVSKKVPIRQAYDFIDTRMGGSMSMEIMLDTGKSDGVKDLKFLKNMDELQTYLNKHPMVTKASSVLDVMKKMRRALHNNNPDFYSLPDTSKAASQYLFFYETSGGDQLDKLVSFDYDIARLTVKMPLAGTSEITEFIEDVETFSKKIVNESVNVEITGSMALTKAMNDRMGEGIKSSFLAVLIAITIMMILFLRSVRLGLISMVPNVFPVLITLGFMGFKGILMSMPLMCCSAIIIGVAVDDTIHFFRRFRREFNARRNYDKALYATLATVGRPLTFTTLTLILGFMVMVFSVMQGWSYFGLLSGFAFFWALMADFFFAPALILLTKPLGPEEA